MGASKTAKELKGAIVLHGESKNYQRLKVIIDDGVDIGILYLPKGEEIPKTIILEYQQGRKAKKMKPDPKKSS